MKNKKKKLNREAYLEKKKAKARINKRMGELKSPYLTEDLLERMAEKNMTKSQKVRRQINTALIMKVAKEQGEEAAGALMMDMMGLSNNPLNRYLPEEGLDDERENDNENLSYKGKLAKSSIPDSDVPGFE